jgi:2,4-dienoyl-CoA reductase-like NADH-dependent reductase (Old Yellow Enzyme family)
VHTLSEASAEMGALAAPLELACGLVLKSRLVKAAMSDSLGDGSGDPTDEQIRLYERWSDGGAALSIIGEVQVDPRFPEKPGNLVLGAQSNSPMLSRLAQTGTSNGSHIWPQLGHAGALAHPPISDPAGPSALELDGLNCDALSSEAIDALPNQYAAASRRARAAGFSGVEVHAGHGFLLSQFLSPLFNHRTDQHGGAVEARGQIVLDIVRRVRQEVGAEFAIAVKMNATDQLEGGLTEDEALVVVEMLGRESVDLIDISGGTYFPGAASSSDRSTTGPYFLDFARRARGRTNTPLMLTGGIKSREEAAAAIMSGAVDAVGLARSLVLDPALPSKWLSPEGGDPEFPTFSSPPPGGVTAWYTMRLTALANHEEASFDPELQTMVDEYERRDADRVNRWNHKF